MESGSIGHDKAVRNPDGGTYGIPEVFCQDQFTLPMHYNLSMNLNAIEIHVPALEISVCLL